MRLREPHPAITCSTPRQRRDTFVYGVFPATPESGSRWRAAPPCYRWRQTRRTLPPGGLQAGALLFAEAQVVIPSLARPGQPLPLVHCTLFRQTRRIIPAANPCSVNAVPPDHTTAPLRRRTAASVAEPASLISRGLVRGIPRKPAVLRMPPDAPRCARPLPTPAALPAGARVHTSRCRGRLQRQYSAESVRDRRPAAVSSPRGPCIVL